jgi:acyl carrier protein
MTRGDYDVVTPEDAVLEDTPADTTTASAPGALAHGTEQALAEVLAGIMGTEQVSVDAHFFDDLGADSMLMARFCARVRKRADLPTASMPDVYEHPTVRSLAAALAGTSPTPPRDQPLRRLRLLSSSRRGVPAMVTTSSAARCSFCSSSATPP